jgi:hypothetical protein
VCGRRARLASVDQVDGIGRRADVTEDSEERRQRRLVKAERMPDVGIGDHRDAVAEFTRIARRRLAAHVGDETRDEQGVDGARLELTREVAKAGEERAGAELDRVEVITGHIERRSCQPKLEGFPDSDGQPSWTAPSRLPRRGSTILGVRDFLV